MGTRAHARVRARARPNAARGTPWQSELCNCVSQLDVQMLPPIPASVMPENHVWSNRFRRWLEEKPATGTHAGTGAKEENVSGSVGLQNENLTEKRISSFRAYCPR
jgi:hypothetical protein